MTPERWQSVKAVLAEALELDPLERVPYAVAACRGDAALAADVERLLQAEAMAGRGFLAEPPLVVPPAGLSSFTAPSPDGDDFDGERPIDPWIGRQLGAYRIVAPLGAGGMGAVYRATRVDNAYQAEVAIKVVRDEPGAAFVNRFKVERQILAALQHHHIARLLDAGTTRDGVPYFVMELIAGTPISEFCRAGALSIEARLELFLVVCSAVDYAHHRLVVHRDIKPGNILVTADAVPKLLDFGIARVLGSERDASASLTRSGPLPMTPAYASPEQLRGEEITTATDVYSLGLVLYELLAGRRAFDVETKLPHEAARILLETEPPRPSAAAPDRLRRRLAGDLDTIVLKAIRKDPRERYASVEQLAADIRRHLEGRPIAARNDSVRYRCGKFIRRNAAAVAVAAAVLASLAASGFVAVRSVTAARAARVRAQERLDDLKQLARTNLFELNDSIRALPGSAPARNLLIERTLQYLDRLNVDSGGARDLQEELAVGYERIAQLQGNFSGPGIGDSLAALASYRKAVAIRESLVSARPADATALTALGNLLGNYSFALQLLNHTADSAAAARRGLAVCERLAQLRPGDARALSAEAMAHARLAAVIGGTGSSGSTREIAAAIDHDWRALAILGSLPPAAIDQQVRSAVEHVQMHLGFHLSKARAFGESARVFGTILSVDRAHAAVTPDDLALVYNFRGLMFDRAGDYRRALADYQMLLRLVRPRAASAPGDLQAKIFLAIAEGDVGIETARLGRPSEGLAEIAEAIRIGERLMAADPSALFYADLLVVAYAYQADTLSALGDQTAAAAKYEAALRLATQVSTADPQDLESPLSIAKIHAALAAVLGRAARYRDALQETETARARLAALQGARPSDPEAAYVEDLNRANAVTLRGCLHAPACPDRGRLRLPVLVN